jgi:uncharacterized membrane protein YidH (DUF202 family)
MMKFLAQVDTAGVIGKIKPPVNNALYTDADPNKALGSLLSTGLQLFFFVAALATLLYLLLGAFEWVTSSGEKEKLTKAQNKMQSAVVGLVLIVVVVVVFNVIMGTVLGGKFGIQDGLQFKLPSVDSQTNP